MGKQEELEAALAAAEAELAKAAAYRVTAAADADLDRVRAHCRQIRTALTEMTRAEPVSRPIEQVRKSGRDDVKKPPKEPVARPRKTIRGLIMNGLSMLGPDAAGRRQLARQALMLLALVLAYLQYYFIDINLKVSLLPSITVLLFG